MTTTNLFEYDIEHNELIERKEDEAKHHSYYTVVWCISKPSLSHILSRNIIFVRITDELKNYILLGGDSLDGIHNKVMDLLNIIFPYHEIMGNQISKAKWNIGIPIC